MGNKVIVDLTKLESVGAEDLLRWSIDTFSDKFAIVTSFQTEGTILVDMASRISPRVRVVAVDTGRLPKETLDMVEVIRSRYGFRAEIIRPDPAEVNTMTAVHGQDLFYQGVPLRMLCCELRKVRPLEKFLKGVDAWAVGLRREQSETRSSVAKVASENGRWKIAPIADWTAQQVAAYVREHDVPRHPLYERGYTSIGCAPCTRAVTPGEDERAGRWWWEQSADKECGIHFSADGKARRTVDVLLEEVLARQNA